MEEREEVDVVVVGAGFSGLLQLYQLRKQGYKVKVVEKGGGLGGIWQWTSYPGARVDSYRCQCMNTVWRSYGVSGSTQRDTQHAILKYFEFVDKKWDLSKDIYFNTRVISAEFDNTTNKWHVHAEDEGQKGEKKVFVARFLDLCVGIAAKPYDAPFKGIEQYKGIVHHSNNWPKEVDLRGKRVAVIGTGSSGVQIIQDIAAYVSHLSVFQRTPNIALPMRNYPVTDADKLKYPELLENRLHNFGGFSFRSSVTKMAFDDPPEAREALYESLWTNGGFHLIVGNYIDLLLDEKANMDTYQFWRKKVLERVHNPDMQDKLAPLIPPHGLGAKRCSLEQTYYEVFNQANVDLIDIKANPIEGFTETGIQTKNGVNHEFDVVILATGFDTITGGLHQIDIKGKEGTLLKDEWANGIKTYIGLTSPGFPNLFFFYSAHAPTAFSNGPTCIEIQSDWVVKCINYLRENGKNTIEASQGAADVWSSQVNDVFNFTLVAKANGVFNGGNIPGKRIESLCFVAGIEPYLQACTQEVEDGYTGFVIN